MGSRRMRVGIKTVLFTRASGASGRSKKSSCVMEDVIDRVVLSLIEVPVAGLALFSMACDKMAAQSYLHVAHEQCHTLWMSL